MKQNAFFRLALALLILFSCKKENVSRIIPTIPQDTLATGWKKIAFVDSIPGLSDIFFIGNTGFSIHSTIIYKTTDGGINWIKIPVSVNGLSNIGMGNDQNAIFVGAKNKIIVTHNAGVSFDTVVVADASISDVFFVSATTAYAAGNSIWKTTDAGSSWTKLYDFNVTDRYESLHFINDKTGWVIRKDGLYKTSNGGLAWQAINTGTTIKFEGYHIVFFPDETHGYISDSYSVARTNDGGLSWTKSYTGDLVFHDIHFISANLGYITDKTRILKTIDGGITWNPEVVLTEGRVIELHFIDQNHGWACAPDGILKYEK